MKEYLQNVKQIFNEGVERFNERTGEKTISYFGQLQRYNLENNAMPLLTTKKVFWKGIVAELLWFIAGDTKVSTLEEQGVKIWSQPEWQIGDGTIGKGYSYQWRNCNEIKMYKNLGCQISPKNSTILRKIEAVQVDPKGPGYYAPNSYEKYRIMYKVPGGAVFVEHTVDQLAKIIYDIKNNPSSRRIILDAWNVTQIDEMGLPPCHLLVQFFVNNGELSCLLFQRSMDTFLGEPFNIASYSLLTHMIAHVTGLKAKEFIHVAGDSHIYENHKQQLEEQLKRDPMELPTIELNKEIKDIFEFKAKDIKLINYKSHGKLTGSVAV